MRQEEGPSCNKASTIAVQYLLEEPGADRVFAILDSQTQGHLVDDVIYPGPSTRHPLVARTHAGINQVYITLEVLAGLVRTGSHERSLQDCCRNLVLSLPA